MMCPTSTAPTQGRRSIDRAFHRLSTREQCLSKPLFPGSFTYGVASLPRVPLTRLIPTFFFALALAYLIFVFSVVALLLLHYEVGLPLQLLGVAFLAGAAYVAPLFHLACVASVLEDTINFAALRKSRALLAGKFWPAAAVFLTLDGCFVALQLAFTRLVLDDALGLGLGFQLAAGVATFVVLWAVVLLTLAAQPVIYMVCKNHHHEVVDKAHLDYIREYERLAVDGDNGVELQPVTTEQIPTPPHLHMAPGPHGFVVDDMDGS